MRSESQGALLERPKRQNPPLISLQELESEMKQAQLQSLAEARDQIARLLQRKLKTLQDEIWRIKVQEHAKSTCHSDPFRTEEIKGLAVLEREKELAVKRLQEEQYQQQVNKDKLVVLQRYQENGVEVYEAYNRYLQSEKCRGLRDLPLAYRRIAEDLEALIEHKALAKRALEREKQSTDQDIADLNKKIEVATIRMIYILSPFSYLGSNICPSFPIEGVRPAVAVEVNYQFQEQQYTKQNLQNLNEFQTQHIRLIRLQILNQLQFKTKNLLSSFFFYYQTEKLNLVSSE